MEYLKMAIKESLRMHTPVYSIARTLDQPTQLQSKLLPNQQNITLPKDLDVIINLNVLHRNEENFENAEVNKTFFLSVNKNVYSEPVPQSIR